MPRTALIEIATNCKMAASRSRFVNVSEEVMNAKEENSIAKNTKYADESSRTPA